MPRFSFTVDEIYTSQVDVEAESFEEAQKKVVEHVTDEDAVGLDDVQEIMDPVLSWNIYQPLPTLH